MSARPDCIFCRIVAGEIPATVVEQTEHALAFKDLNPQAPSHLLVIPKRHAEHLGDFIDGADPAEVHDLFALAAKLGTAASPNGFRVVTNQGADAGQSVFHLHLHVLSGRPMSWPPG